MKKLVFIALLSVIIGCAYVKHVNAITADAYRDALRDVEKVNKDLESGELTAEKKEAISAEFKRLEKILGKGSPHTDFLEMQELYIEKIEAPVEGEEFIEDEPVEEAIEIVDGDGEEEFIIEEEEIFEDKPVVIEGDGTGGIPSGIPIPPPPPPSRTTTTTPEETTEEEEELLIIYSTFQDINDALSRLTPMSIPDWDFDTFKEKIDIEITFLLSRVAKIEDRRDIESNAEELVQRYWEKLDTLVKSFIKKFKINELMNINTAKSNLYLEIQSETPINQPGDIKTILRNLQDVVASATEVVKPEPTPETTTYQTFQKKFEKLKDDGILAVTPGFK